jgi:hypothetical protein
LKKKNTSNKHQTFNHKDYETSIRIYQKNTKIHIQTCTHPQKTHMKNQSYVWCTHVYHTNHKVFITPKMCHTYVTFTPKLMI